MIIMFLADFNCIETATLTLCDIMDIVEADTQLLLGGAQDRVAIMSDFPSHMH